MSGRIPPANLRIAYDRIQGGLDILDEAQERAPSPNRLRRFEHSQRLALQDRMIDLVEADTNTPETEQAIQRGIGGLDAIKHLRMGASFGEMRRSLLSLQQELSGPNAIFAVRYAYPAGSTESNPHARGYALTNTSPADAEEMEALEAIFQRGTRTGQLREGDAILAGVSRTSWSVGWRFVLAKVILNLAQNYVQGQNPVSSSRAFSIEMAKIVMAAAVASPSLIRNIRLIAGEMREIALAGLQEVNLTHDRRHVIESMQEMTERGELAAE